MNYCKVLANLILLLSISLFTPNVHSGEVTQSILSSVSDGGTTDGILELPSVVDEVLANPKLEGLSGERYNEEFLKLLKKTTAKSQKSVMATIKRHLAPEDIQQFWITNAISLKNVNSKLAQALLTQPGSHTLRTLTIFQLIQPIEPELRNDSANDFSAKSGYQWGVDKIGAPSVWPKTKGAGVLVATIDTGCNGNHEALSGGYGGKFYDTTTNSDNSGNLKPYDDNGHGTHVMGTICGNKNGIGVAPEAKWIACKGIDGSGSGINANLILCAELLASSKPPPQIISNSWGGGQNDPIFNPVIKVWNAMGIIGVFAIGNSGPGCKTANSPGDQTGIISVGATDSSDKIGSFSSRGYRKGTTIFKPEVSAPGVYINSAWNTTTNAYKILSGTSMATPHVAGTIALLRSINPKLTIDAVMEIFKATTVKPTLNDEEKSCKVSSGSVYLNNVYGYGRIDAYKASTVA